MDTEHNYGEQSGLVESGTTSWSWRRLTRKCMLSQCLMSSTRLLLLVVFFCVVLVASCWLGLGDARRRPPHNIYEDMCRIVAQRRDLPILDIARDQSKALLMHAIGARGGVDNPRLGGKFELMDCFICMLALKLNNPCRPKKPTLLHTP
jgi:hypothetical protein